ncbi:MAG TPA: N-acetyltransferase [Lachnospiraceae bacterium]|nr:N-acetyltransferase [Lachnospiraceae bacterium]
MRTINLEVLNENNMDAVRVIRREDISEDFVDDADTIIEYAMYGIRHHCIGYTYAVYCEDICIGMLLLGEAIPWETDPEEMRERPFYRLMGFVIDQRYRGQGIGGYVLEKAVESVYRDFGVRPIALGVHKDNHAAAKFYERHGFRKTEVLEGNDYYYLRYPDSDAR